MSWNQFMLSQEWGTIRHTIIWKTLQEHIWEIIECLWYKHVHQRLPLFWHHFPLFHKDNNRVKIPCPFLYSSPYHQPHFLIPTLKATPSSPHYSLMCSLKLIIITRTSKVPIDTVLICIAYNLAHYFGLYEGDVVLICIRYN